MLLLLLINFAIFYKTPAEVVGQEDFSPQMFVLLGQHAVIVRDVLGWLYCWEKICKIASEVSDFPPLQIW